MTKIKGTTKNFFTSFVNNESGNAAMEYGLLGSLIAVAIIAGTSAVGQGVSDTLQETAQHIGSGGSGNNSAGSSPLALAGGIPLNIPPANSRASDPGNGFGG